MRKRVPDLLFRAAATLLLCGVGWASGDGEAEIIRDTWGVPHVYASGEQDGFFGVGWAAAEDRLLQMELFRRRARGTLAEAYGPRWVDHDRRFRIAGVGRYCDEAASALPEDLKVYFRGYAAGVNAWVKAHPDKARRRLAPLGVAFPAWTEGDCICAWMAVGTLFDALYDENAVETYRGFRQLAERIGEEAALLDRGQIVDDAAAIVSEAEMAKNRPVYARLKAQPRMPGYWMRSLSDEMLRFSHAWAVGGTRSATGKPLLESDPQTPVNNPPLWYEFHIAAGRYDVRGIGVAGSPAMLIGFNRHVAWGVTALGAGSVATFIEKLSPDGRGYFYRGQTLPLERRLETISVQGGEAVAQEVLRTRHGFAFNPLMRDPRPGELYVSHYVQAERRTTSLVGLLNMMGAANWEEFRDAMRHYYSPGIHVVYADIGGNLGYQTLVHVPLARWTARMALEGWTGDHEILGRIPLDEMPHMLNPEAGFISHANNLPVGSWYPYDLGIGTGGIGHSSRSLRLVDLLSVYRPHTVDSFEAEIHRDDVQASIAEMFPVARRLAEQSGALDRETQELLRQLRDWDLRFRASQPTYPGAAALTATALLNYRRSGLNSRLGGGEGGIAHLARRLREQFGAGGAPVDPEVREYLLSWLRAAAQELQRVTGGRPPVAGPSRLVHRMPYQANGPMALPALDPSLELVSPPLECGEIGTIWSQPGNSYTQIVDLSDIDNSRAILPPGVPEDSDSPFHAGQMKLWAEGRTRPAPLSREKVEAIMVSRQVVRAER